MAANFEAVAMPAALTPGPSPACRRGELGLFPSHSAWDWQLCLCCSARCRRRRNRRNRPSVYVFPAGGQRGKAIEVTVVGKNLQGTNAVRLSGPGITAGVVKVENPTTVHILVAIAADAPLGERDVRLVTRGGISNRFRFFVGELPEDQRNGAELGKRQAAAAGIAAGGG